MSVAAILIFKSGVDALWRARLHKNLDKQSESKLALAPKFVVVELPTLNASTPQQ